MSVEIEPLELGFQRPLTVEVSQILKIRNPNHTPVAFKVKTTAPKQYCVRPNSGKIEPGKEVEVTVLLQAMKTEPPLDAKCRDKFLVQSVAVTADKAFTNIGAIWQHVDDAERSAVQEMKIRVFYLPPPVEGSAPAVTPLKSGVNGISNGAHGTPDSTLQSYRSPSPEETFTPSQRSSAAPAGPVSKLNEEPSDTKSLGDAKASASNPATSSSIKNSVVSAASAASDAVPTSYEELKAQLSQAQATIASYGQEGGLRLRKAVGADSPGTIANDVVSRIQGSEGVPVKIVAALCLLSFLLAYIFF